MTRSVRGIAEEVIGDWRRERPDLDVDALSVTYRLLRVGRRLQSRLDRIAAEHGLSHKGDLDVLTALVRAGSPHELSPSRLADELLLTAGGMTTRLDRLENAGLIRRRPSTADRRSVLVALTERGAAMADSAFRDVLAAQSAVIAPVDPSARATVIEALERIESALGTGEGA